LCSSIYNIIELLVNFVPRRKFSFLGTRNCEATTVLSFGYNNGSLSRMSQSRNDDVNFWLIFLFRSVIINFRLAIVTKR